MYVCVCRAVRDTEVAEVIEAGADTIAKVTAACGAGGGCGACHAMIEDMIEERCCGGRRHLPIARTDAAEELEERAA